MGLSVAITERKPRAFQKQVVKEDAELLSLSLRQTEAGLTVFRVQMDLEGQGLGLGCEATPGGGSQGQDWCWILLQWSQEHRKGLCL